MDDYLEKQKCTACRYFQKSRGICYPSTPAWTFTPNDETGTPYPMTIMPNEVNDCGWFENEAEEGPWTEADEEEYGNWLKEEEEWYDRNQV